MDLDLTKLEESMSYTYNDIQKLNEELNFIETLKDSAYKWMNDEIDNSVDRESILKSFVNFESAMKKIEARKTILLMKSSRLNREYIKEQVSYKSLLDKRENDALKLMLL